MKTEEEIKERILFLKQLLEQEVIIGRIKLYEDWIGCLEWVLED